MTVVRCALKGREYVSCNRAYGCPCQFNSLPTYGKCHEVVSIVDAKASPEQRDALLRTMSGLDTEPGRPSFKRPAVRRGAIRLRAGSTGLGSTCRTVLNMTSARSGAAPHARRGRSLS